MIFSFKQKRKVKKLKYLVQGLNGYSSEIGLVNFEIREAWLKRVLSSFPNGLRILDAGAGECQYQKYCTHLEYVSQDFAQYDGVGNNEGLQMKKWDNSKLNIISDIVDIPVESESFDIVMCTEVLEHVPDPVAALKELNRVLKYGGHLIITAPFNSITHFAPYHFFSGFNKYFYMDWCKKNSFEIVELIPNGNYFNYLAQEVRRIDKIAEEYSDTKLEPEQINIIDDFLLLLSQIEDKKQSSDLLCFGYHLLAKK